AQPSQAGFYCYDPTLAQRLRQAADQADQAVDLKLREARFTEGPAGVANAIKNLWSNIGTYTSSLASYVISGGADTGKRTASGDPVTGRDLIALLATIVDDLGLLRVLSKHELKRFGREEMRDSYTDLTPFRQERSAEAAAQGPPKLWARWFGATGWPPKGGGPHVRNHGLLSKAQRALDIAGWSPAAQRDVEIFRLVDSEGLTPLLTLLNEA